MLLNVNGVEDIVVSRAFALGAFAELTVSFNMWVRPPIMEQLGCHLTLFREIW